jgi:hypothetical protein
MDSRLSDGLIERLAPDLRCIALDLPFGAHRHALRHDADLSARGVAQLVADALAALDVEGRHARRQRQRRRDRAGRRGRAPPAPRAARADRATFDNFPPKFFISLVWAAHLPGALTAAILPLRIRAPHALPIAYGWVTERRPLPHRLIAEWVRAYFADRGVRRDLAKVTRGLTTA